MYYYTDGFVNGIRLHCIIYNIFDINSFKDFLINTHINFLKTIVDNKYGAILFIYYFKNCLIKTLEQIINI